MGASESVTLSAGFADRLAPGSIVSPWGGVLSQVSGFEAESGAEELARAGGLGPRHGKTLYLLLEGPQTVGELATELDLTLASTSSTGSSTSGRRQSLKSAYVTVS